MTESTAPAGSPPPGIGRRLAAGIGAQGLSNIVVIVGQLASVPVFLTAWGPGLYADWLVLASVAGLLALGDCGLHGFLSNALRAAWARGDEAAGRRILQSGLGAYAVLTGCLAAAVVAAVALDAPALLRLSTPENAGATLLLLALAVVVLLPRGLVATVHSARGRFHREVMGITLTYGAQIGAGILTALAGGSPLHAAAAQLAAAVVVGWGVLLRELRCDYGHVSLRPLPPTRAELRLLARKAPLYAVDQGSVVIVVNAPVILLGWLAPAAAVVTFTTVRTFTGLVRQTARQAATALGLEMARMHACGDRAGAGRLYAAGGPVVGCAVALLAAAAWGAGPAVFRLWTHGAMPFDPVTGAAFLAGALIQVPAYGAAGLLRLVDRPESVATAQAAETAAIILLGLLLIPRGGAAGAALAVTLAEAVASMPLHLRAAGRLLGQSTLRLALRSYAVAALALVLAMLAFIASSRVAPPDGIFGLALFMAAWTAVAIPALIGALFIGHRVWVRERLERMLCRVRWPGRAILPGGRHARR
ncbi:hypothetical protein [Azospirillum halopraeferens]|uniref:hypothetical protein n=1 Tax=Azospirillum halopraeferens TaxID=34010 RepID=UPI00041009E1|nr:hypothetical protein [Azospirillum halopraeferens]